MKDTKYLSLRGKSMDKWTEKKEIARQNKAWLERKPNPKVKYKKNHPWFVSDAIAQHNIKHRIKSEIE